MMMWRAIEWTAVMGVLCWLLVQAWSDQPFDRRMRRARRSAPDGEKPDEGMPEGWLATFQPKERPDASNRATGGGPVLREL